MLPKSRVPIKRISLYSCIKIEVPLINFFSAFIERNGIVATVCDDTLQSKDCRLTLKKDTQVNLRQSLLFKERYCSVMSIITFCQGTSLCGICYF